MGASLGTGKTKYPPGSPIYYGQDEDEEDWITKYKSKKIHDTTKDQMIADFQKRKDRWVFDIKHTPCARDSFINGIIGGLAVGMLYFLKSSKVQRSCDFAVGGFIVIGYGTWRYCRHKMMSEYWALQNVTKGARKRKESTVEAASTEIR